MRKIEVKQLEYFLAVAEHLSFTKAAEELRVAQPAISQQIKYLEFVLGLPLFNRDNKKVALTEAGKLFRQNALKVLDSLDEALGVIDELKGLARGSVSIAMSSTVATILMADLIQEFRSKFPDIKVRAREAMTIESIQNIQNGELDLAIVTLPIQEDHSHLTIDHLYDEDLAAIVSAKHPLAQVNHEAIDLKELLNYEWILANSSNGLRRLINEACTQKGFCPLVSIEVDRISSVKNLLIYSETGVTILPPTAVLNELSLGLVKQIRFKDTHIFRSVGLASKPADLLPPATLEMIGVIKQICHNYPERSLIAHPTTEFTSTNSPVSALK